MLLQSTQAVAVDFGGALCQPPQIPQTLPGHPTFIKLGWTVHSTRDGRLYYCNHVTRTAGWLPPAETWGTTEVLPYGWERAIDIRGKPYYINHVNKTTTYEAPERSTREIPPEPRVLTLTRSPSLGFGFVAGSERPVIVRFVTEGGPSVGKLEPGDQILYVNGEDVKQAPRDHVIQLVRSSDSQVTLVVCQPVCSGATGRKSTLLSVGKRAKLKSCPNRVRFAESVCVNGAPLFPPSAFSLGDLCVPPMANVLKVFLENGQTKSFKYDATTTVHDVVKSLKDKLCLIACEHFSLVLEHVKSLRRNKLTLLDPEETLDRIASRPGAQKLRCLFRVSFVPITAALLAQRDLNALEYLYMQCCNDVAQERFAPELQPEVALRLAALHMHQHALANNMSTAKLTVKAVEREFGLERFVPCSLLESMKRKELRRLIGHFLKLNQHMTGSANKQLTALQAKLHYLDIISALPSYGAKCFSTNQRENSATALERVVLVSPRFGLSQISSARNSVPTPISNLEDISNVTLTQVDELTYAVAIYLKCDRVATFSMEDRDASELALVLAGYYRLITGKSLHIDQEKKQLDDCIAPPYLSQHNVVPEKWSYIYDSMSHITVKSMAFTMPPPYHEEILKLRPSESIRLKKVEDCDRNMNSTLSNNNHAVYGLRKFDESSCIGSLAYDIHNVTSAENGGQDSRSNVAEVRNQQVLRHVAEMERLVQNSEQYLHEQSETTGNNIQCETKHTDWHETAIDYEIESDTESSHSRMSFDNNSVTLKHSDSLILLAEVINQGLNGINQGLTAMFTTEDNKHSMQGLSRVLSGCGATDTFNALNADYSQSESDNDSLYTPNNSPSHKNQQKNMGKCLRTSFGLHSPNNSTLSYDNSRDPHLKEYLKQLRESAQDVVFSEDLMNRDVYNGLSASLLYGFRNDDESVLENESDLIDLTFIPPPPTPDELDNVQTILNAPPTSFADENKQQNSNLYQESTSTLELEEFLATVAIEPPTQKVTPALELTPEEILSYIIPPPPKTIEYQVLYGNQAQIESERNSCTANIISNDQTCNGLVDLSMSESFNVAISNETKTNNKLRSNPTSALYSTKLDSGNTHEDATTSHHVIEYSTVDRKGPFSCCAINKNEKHKHNEINTNYDNCDLTPPPRKSSTDPPDRPPKNTEQKTYCSLQLPNGNSTSATDTCLDSPPLLPPRNYNSTCHPPSYILIPPKKPPMPPVPSLEVLRMKNTQKTHHPVVKSAENASAPQHRVAGIGSPHLHRNKNMYRDIDAAFPVNSDDFVNCSTRSKGNGHFRSHSESLQNQFKNCSLSEPRSNVDSSVQQSPNYTIMCSPQSSRKTFERFCDPSENSNITVCEQPLKNFPHFINTEALLGKTDIAMAGLLVRLDQVATQCNAAQAAGGGTSINEDKFQIAREELTNQALQLVTSSKLLVISMSDISLSKLPEHLASCLTALRRITELSQDLTVHTSAPLQTRNIVLKVHDVASSFRELANTKVRYGCNRENAGQLALRAECLANVLATLLRSLRVFSP